MRPINLPGVRSLLTSLTLSLLFEARDASFPPGRLVVRRLVSMLLSGLILACPYLCGADEAGQRMGHAHVAGQSGSDDAPAHCPESSDNCVCQGAIQTNDAGATTPDAEGSTPFFFVIPTFLFAHPLHHLTCEGSPTGLASWGDSLTIRAVLQNFRC